MKRFWIAVAVASAEHVRLGKAGGFMQVCHGKGAPLRRIQPGDLVVYYSPAERFGQRSPLQSFTALGEVLPGAPYQVDMGGGFQPFRRDVGWCDAMEAPIAPLLPRLAFCAGQRNWGYALRFGLLGIAQDDFSLIAAAMRVEVMYVAASVRAIGPQHAPAGVEQRVLEFGAAQ